MTLNIGLKRDTVELLIVQTLEAAGATVARLSGEAGLPDLLVGFRGANYLLEVKTGKPRLRPAQQAWLRKWRGDLPWVVCTPEEALEAIGGGDDHV